MSYAKRILIEEVDGELSIRVFRMSSDEINPDEPKSFAEILGLIEGARIKARCDFIHAQDAFSASAAAKTAPEEQVMDKEPEA